MALLATFQASCVECAYDTFLSLLRMVLMHLFISQPLRGVGILKLAIDKMQINTNQLTSVHADLCQVSKLIRINRIFDFI